MNKLQIVGRLMAASTLGSCCLIAQGAAAQDAQSSSDQGIADIIVTAQKRSEALQKVPISISAVNAAMIEDRRIDDITDIGRVAPSLQINQYFSALQINLRGLGYEASNPAQDPSVVLYVDGVLSARPTGTAAVFEDLERIEVLRGPQGTLYGRNAVGGVVNLITRTPTVGAGAKGNFSLTYGRWNRVKAAAGVDIGLGEKAALRISGLHENSDGDILNVFDGRKVNNLKADALRATLVLEPTESLTITARGDLYSDERGAYFDYMAPLPFSGPFGITPSNPDPLSGTPGAIPPVPGIRPAGLRYNDGRHVNIDGPSRNNVKNYGGSLTIDYDINDSVWFRSITAYRENKHTYRMDPDGSTSFIIHFNIAHEDSKTLSQEINFGGDLGNGGTWVVGGYYLNDKLDLNYDFTFGAIPLALDRLTGRAPGTTPGTLFNLAQQSLKSYSVFAQGTYPVTDKLDFTAGARGNWDKRNNNSTVFIGFQGYACQNVYNEDSWSDITYKGVANYKFTENNMAYASVSKGFKAGGLDIGTCGRPFKQEDLMAYEVGTKNVFADGAVVLNLAAFYYNYKNIQTARIEPTQLVVENAASASIYGIEVELQARPASQLELGLNVSYLHSRYGDYFTPDPSVQFGAGYPAGGENIKGNRIAHTPDWTASGYAAYTLPVANGGLRFGYDFSYNGGWYGDIFNNRSVYQSGHMIHNAKISYRTENLEVGGFVDNFTDKLFANSRLIYSSTNSITAMWGPRRTWGIFLKGNFE